MENIRDRGKKNCSRNDQEGRPLRVRPFTQPPEKYIPASPPSPPASEKQKRNGIKSSYSTPNPTRQGETSSQAGACLLSQVKNYRAPTPFRKPLASGYTHIPGRSTSRTPARFWRKRRSSLSLPPPVPPPISNRSQEGSSGNVPIMFVRVDTIVPPQGPGARLLAWAWEKEIREGKKSETRNKTL